MEADIREIKEKTTPLDGLDQLEPLVQDLKGLKCVLLGEASHGTSEFYRYRNRVTRKLIEEQDISFIAVEGDWPDCYKINQYVKGRTDETAKETLSKFDRWPTWMWANWEILEFIEWLREHNKGLEEERKVGFFGLDVYSLNDSMERLIDYLETIDDETAEEAKKAYACIDGGRAGAEYAEKLRLAPESCEDEVTELLTEIRRKKFEYEKYGPKEYFDAEQNALITKNAEKYYRSLVSSTTNSWNVRDRHMMETLEKLMDDEGAAAKSIVWAHNSHIGDSTATDMEIRGEINLGKLVRDRWDETALVGFSTYTGKVVAARNWGGEMQEMEVPEAEKDSHEEMLHQAGGDRLISMEDLDLERRGHRAIGVVYHPESEGQNYVPTTLQDRYDQLIFLDETTSLHPLELKTESVEPETYPWGV